MRAHDVNSEIEVNGEGNEIVYDHVFKKSEEYITDFLQSSPSEL